MNPPLCFVLIPSGCRADGVGGRIDFDAIYDDLLAPAIGAAGMTPVRATMVGTGLQPALLDPLMLCEYAVVDLSDADRGVFYGLGLRHAVRASRTLTLCAEGCGPGAADLALLDPLAYRLDAVGRPAAPGADIAALAARLRRLREGAPTQRLFHLVEAFPDIQRLKSDLFRERVGYAEGPRVALAAARAQGEAAVAEVEAGLGNLEGVEAGVWIDLFLSYRAVKAWGRMIALAGRMPLPLGRSLMVREQLAFALNRAGRGGEAEGLLRELIAERGPSSETCSLLGRVYKDRWEAALKEGSVSLAADWLDQAIEAYLQGFEADWRDAYPGINAVTLMELRDPPDPRRQELIPVVRYAVQRRIQSGRPDYWDHATRLELALLAADPQGAADALADALATRREAWEGESTARNLRLIREAREARGEEAGWSREIERALLG